MEGLLKQQAADLQSDADASWSLHIAEKPVNVMAATRQTKKPDDQTERADLIKFSVTEKSDLMKFSAINADGIESLPQQMSDMMKFSDAGVAKESEVVST